MSHMPRYKLIKEKAYWYCIYPYRIHTINETSLLYHNKQKQAIALLPVLGEKLRATYVFLLKHGSDGKIVYNIK